VERSNVLGHKNIIRTRARTHARTRTIHHNTYHNLAIFQLMFAGKAMEIIDKMYIRRVRAKQKNVAHARVTLTQYDFVVDD